MTTSGAFESFVNLRIEEGGVIDKYRFVLIAPASLTVKKGGRYSKRSFIGEESFLLTSVYVGKRKGNIFVFKQHGLFEDVEIPESDCQKLLTGFPDFFDWINSEYESSLIETSRLEGEEIERTKYNLDSPSRLLKNPEFGSW